jgi:DNA-directed RNA polymerase subunit omega
MQKYAFAILAPPVDKLLKNRYNLLMIFPLKDLIEYDENMYEITSAASRRAYQLSSVLEKEEKEDYNGKMVALAAREVFTHKVQFRLETE